MKVTKAEDMRMRSDLRKNHPCLPLAKSLRHLVEDPKIVGVHLLLVLSTKDLDSWSFLDNKKLIICVFEVQASINYRCGCQNV